MTRSNSELNCAKCGADLSRSFSANCWLCGQIAPTTQADAPPNIVVAELVHDLSHQRMHKWVAIGVLMAATMIACGLAFVDLGWCILFAVVALPAILLAVAQQEAGGVRRPNATARAARGVPVDSTWGEVSVSPSAELPATAQVASAVYLPPDSAANSASSTTANAILLFAGRVLMYGFIVAGVVGIVLIAAIVALFAVCLVSVAPGMRM